MKNLQISILIILAALACFAQTTTTSTTLSVAITSTSLDRVTLASGTNVAANGQIFVDQELMYVVGAVNGSTTVWQVQRGAGGTLARTHASAATVWVAPPGNALRSAFVTQDIPAGSCTAGTLSFAYSPVVNVSNGNRFTCVGSKVVRVAAGAQQVSFCGATTGDAACANTAAQTTRIIGGIATLASNAAVISGISPAFTSTTSFACVANDTTTRANVVQAVNTSTSSITITNTTGASDVISWVCVGY